jgi:hypothetical protein
MPANEMARWFGEGPPQPHGVINNRVSSVGTRDQFNCSIYSQQATVGAGGVAPMPAFSRRLLQRPLNLQAPA